MDADLMKIDLYELLQIEANATEKEIKKAYRKKALTCHPDKNPDDPKAAETFQQLSKALEILTDGAAKAAYDRLLKSRRERVVRHRELDAKRRKLKEDLEAREKSAREPIITEADAAKNLQEHIERLRKEGSKHLEEERLLLKKQIEEELKLIEAQGREEANRPKLKFTWKASKKDPENGGYNHDKLMEIFQKYGEVTGLVLGKRGSCLVEYKHVEAASQAHEVEKGLEENPLTGIWLQGKPTEDTRHAKPVVSQPLFPNINFAQFPTVATDGVTGAGTITNRDYESIVLTKMRQAQERKRLIEEMEKNQG